MSTPRLFPVSALARAADSTESLVRYLTKRGVLHPLRDEGGRYLYTEADAATVRAHLAHKAERTAA